MVQADGSLLLLGTVPVCDRVIHLAKVMARCEMRPHEQQNSGGCLFSVLPAAPTRASTSVPG